MATTDELGIPEFLDRRAKANAKPSPVEAVARPLRELVALIRKDLEAGRAAAERAGMPYYRAAGEKLIEAKAHMKHGEFGPWIKRTFKLSARHARYYMRLAQATSGAQIGSAEPFSSLNDFRRSLGETRHSSPRQPSRDERVAEREAERKMALRLIAVGYRALAAELHPDKQGGSRDAMALLNRVRDWLRRSVPYQCAPPSI